MFEKRLKLFMFLSKKCVDERERKGKRRGEGGSLLYTKHGGNISVTRPSLLSDLALAYVSTLMFNVAFLLLRFSAKGATKYMHVYVIHTSAERVCMNVRNTHTYAPHPI